ncbi:MAG: 2-hydroxyacyl-CoA dehydratase [Chloroflexi bacterium]|nr:2-hydroxyacyl-CoA dehydratase [Chloroflexota bacterium]
MLAKLEEIYKNRHQYAKDWKARTGGKVLGYFYPYVPEEIVYAAGVLPVRIMGSHEHDNLSAAYIYPMYCPFCRDTLAEGLRGRYSYLDGLACADTCMHMNQVFDWFVLNCGIPRRGTFIANTPANVAGTHARTYLIKEHLEFKKAIEGWVGRVLSDKDLDRGIEIMNRNRQLMRQVYETRKREKPPITGAEAQLMVLTSQFSDKEEHSALLEDILNKELPGRNRDRKTGVRLMIVGSEDDDTAFLKMAESLGVTFVIDDTCVGSRYFWHEVVPGKDRVAAIANHYLDSTPFPTKDWSERRRFAQVLKLAEEYNVQGVVLAQQKWCDPYELDIPSLAARLKERNIPTLFLEFEPTLPRAPFTTRIEAFVEMLCGDEEGLFAESSTVKSGS